MCTLVQVGATLPYQGGQKAAKYQVYAPDDISLPAQTAVQILLGYRVNLQPLLMIHMFATIGLKSQDIWAMEIHDGNRQHILIKRICRGSVKLILKPVI